MLWWVMASVTKRFGKLTFTLMGVVNTGRCKMLFFVFHVKWIFTCFLHFHSKYSGFVHLVLYSLEPNKQVAPSVLRITLYYFELQHFT